MGKSSNLGYIMKLIEAKNCKNKKEPFEPQLETAAAVNRLSLVKRRFKDSQHRGSIKRRRRRDQFHAAESKNIFKICISCCCLSIAAAGEGNGSCFKKMKEVFIVSKVGQGQIQTDRDKIGKIGKKRLPLSLISPT